MAPLQRGCAAVQFLNELAVDVGSLGSREGLADGEAVRRDAVRTHPWVRAASELAARQQRYWGLWQPDLSRA